jgi:hypothetical protein
LLEDVYFIFKKKLQASRVAALQASYEFSNTHIYILEPSGKLRTQRTYSVQNEETYHKGKIRGRCFGHINILEACLLLLLIWNFHYISFVPRMGAISRHIRASQRGGVW